MAFGALRTTNWKTMKTLTGILFALIFIAPQIKAYSNGTDTITCSGCELTIDVKKPASYRNNDSYIKFKTLVIKDAVDDSCAANNPNTYKAIDVHFEITTSSPTETCTAGGGSDCSSAQCEVDVDIQLIVADHMGTGGAPECLLAGSRLEVLVKWRGWSKLITNEELKADAQGWLNSPAAVTPVHTITVDGSCGSSSDLGLSADILYLAKRDTFVEPKLVPYNFDSVSVNCEPCQGDTTVSTNPGGNSGDKIKPFSSSKLLKVYPNPANSEVNFVAHALSNGADVSIQITNLVGQTVYNSIHTVGYGKNKTTVDISDLPDGTYFYTYTLNKEMHQGKFEIRH